MKQTGGAGGRGQGVWASVILLISLCLSPRPSPLAPRPAIAEAAVSAGQDSQLDTGLSNQGGVLSATPKFRQQSAIGDALSSNRLFGSRFHIFPGFLGGGSSNALPPINELDIKVLYAKTDSLGARIDAGAWQKDKDPVFLWEAPVAVENVLGYSYALDGAPDDTIDTTALSFNIATATPDTLADGKHTFSVKAIGTGGLAGNPISTDLWVDTTPPQILSKTPEPSSLHKTAPTVTAAVSDAHSGANASSIAVVVNGTAATVQFDAATGQASATGGGWAEGTNSIELRVADAVGNAQTPVVWSVTLDRVPPAGTVVINGEGIMTTSAYVTLALAASDATSGVAHVLIRNTAAGGYVQEPFAAVRPLWKLKPVRGIQTVYVKFVDQAGNESARVSDSIELALLSPETAITGGPAGFTAETAATFTFMCPEGGCVFSYAFDNEEWSGWTNATTASAGGLSFGNHYFRVKAAKDVNGEAGIQLDEEDPSPAERTWIVGVEPSLFGLPKGPPIKLWRLE